MTTTDLTPNLGDDTPDTPDETVAPATGLVVRSRPYVGVSGVVSGVEQVEMMAQAGAAWVNTASDTAVGSGAQVPMLLFGIKATHKTQWLCVENKYGPGWYPVGEAGFREAVLEAENQIVETVISPTGHIIENVDTFRVAQVYFDADQVGDRDYRDRFMDRLAERGSYALHGLQFDMLPWHLDPSIGSWLAALKDRTGLKIVLQAHGPAMNELGPDGVVARLERMPPVVDYVLFDSSHGTGTPMVADRLVPFLDAAYASEELAHVGFGVAGGLDADSVRVVMPSLLARFPGLSWDAEGSLHHTRDGAAKFDVNAASRYLLVSGSVLRAQTAQGEDAGRADGAEGL